MKTLLTHNSDFRLILKSLRYGEKIRQQTNILSFSTHLERQKIQGNSDDTMCYTIARFP